LLDLVAVCYMERLEAAGLADDRPAAQSNQGGFAPWLYYQAGALALELDVWGIPKAEKAAAEGGAAEALTVDRVAAMSSDDFLALGEEKIAAFLKENKVPPQFGAQQVMAALKGGQLDPAKMAQMIRSGGGGGGGGGSAGKGKGGEREREVLAWLDAHNPGAVAPWTAVTLPDGTKAEAGGLDPFAAVAPPWEILAPALAAHTATEDLGGGVYRVKAVAANRGGGLATHTKMAERSRARLPIRLELAPAKDVKLLTGAPARATERIVPGGAFEAEWLVQAPRGARVTVAALSEHAGTAERSITLGAQKGEGR
jgi:hypothetical protein